MRIKLTWTRILILSLLVLAVFGGIAQASGLTLTDVFKNDINSYVNSILNTSNDVKTFAWMILLFLVFLALFSEICRFIFEGLNAAQHLTTVIMILVTLVVWGSYTYFIDMIWGAGDALGMAFQKVATGYDDPLFLSKWTVKTVGQFVFDDFNLWSAGQSIVLGVIWSFIVLIIQILMYLAAMFAVWGLALSKIIGIIFIPFLAFEPTRKLFDSWLRFFIGFIFLMIVLRITSVLAALTIQSQLKHIGITCSNALICIGSPVNGSVANINFYSNPDLMFSTIIAIVFMCSSFAFAKQLGSGVGSASTGMGRYARKAAARALKALVL